MTPTPPMTPRPMTPASTRRFLIILWAVLLGTIGFYYYLTTVLPADKADPKSPLVFPLLGLAILAALASFYFKAYFGAREGRPRSLAMVRLAYVVALVFDEVPAILGFIVYWVSAWPQNWVFFVISAAGFAVNFPQREDFENGAGNS
jgi:hypothetical protein